MADIIYNSAKGKLMDGSIDLDTDTINIALVTSSYTPNQDTHEDFDDITNEVTDTGYTAGGATLSNVSISINTTDNRAELDADDVTWSDSSITARGAVIYKDTGTAGTSWLICYLDFTSDYTSTNSDFTITWGADGIINLS